MTRSAQLRTDTVAKDPVCCNTAQCRTDGIAWHSMFLVTKSVLTELSLRIPKIRTGSVMRHPFSSIGRKR